MMHSTAPDDPRPGLIHHARSFYNRGWMWGTAGNLSAKSTDGSFWITASGCSKGELQVEQFVRLSIAGDLLEQPTSNAKPSAETSIHQAIYDLFPEAWSCYHVHSIPGNLVSRITDKTQLQLPAIEMIKGMGIWDENPVVFLDLFPNHSHVPKIADEMRDRFTQSPPQLSACLIQDHGVTVWGKSQEETRNRVEIMEYLFQYMITARSLPSPNQIEPTGLI
jgi:methylthioribulose-1-phosphate dehydratase